MYKPARAERHRDDCGEEDAFFMKDLSPIRGATESQEAP